jgi:glycosyltransferase involved in cell wall biosynthesis
MRIVSIIEATTVNAVAKVALEFLRTAREMAQHSGDPPVVEGSFVTFERTSGHRESPNEFVVATRAAGIEIDVISERRRFDISVIPLLRTVIERRLPELVITHSVKSHFLLWRSELWKKYPWLAFHHGYTTTDRKMRLYNRLDRWSLPKADRILTVCRAFAEELAAITKVPVERILVQHNAIREKPRPDAAAVQALRERLKIAGNERVILSVGRLSKEKAHVDLIAAFKRLRETNPNLDCKLVIVGNGPERQQLESVAREMGKGERVVFAGQVADVQPFYALADVFALSSHSEGSPNALLEAMSARVPVVATAVGGIPEIVSNDESAVLIPPNEPAAMAAAVERVLTNSELAQRLALRAAELISKHYTPEIHVKNSIEIYREVLKGRTENSTV